MDASIREELDLNHYDFLDFGASKGVGIEFAIQRFGGKRGLGIDLDPKKVATMRQHGFSCMQADVTSLNLPGDAVRFVTLFDFLEHLPTLDKVAQAIANAADVASDFLHIRGPYFDADEYLKSHELKLFWSDWSGHLCHLTISQLGDILQELNLTHYVLGVRDPITDSSAPAVHPLASPSNQQDYDPAVHPPKPPFDGFPVYRQMLAYVQLRPIDYFRQLIHKEGRRLIVLEDTTTQ